MARCFTHYWKNRTWEDHDKSGWFQRHNLEHIAGNLFFELGVGVGDFVYAVTVQKGFLYLGGRMKVEKVATQAESDEFFGEQLWPASTHLIASKMASTPMRFDRVVPETLVERLNFISREGMVQMPLLFVAPGRLDKQALRGVRELTPESAGLLDSVLAGES